MAVRLDEIEREERARLQPHVDRLESLVRARDPHARFALRTGHEPGFWELDAYMREDVTDDPDFAHVIAEAGTEILLDYDVAIAVILRTADGRTRTAASAGGR